MDSLGHCRDKRATETVIQDRHECTVRYSSRERGSNFEPIEASIAEAIQWWPQRDTVLRRDATEIRFVSCRCAVLLFDWLVEVPPVKLRVAAS